MSTNSLNLGAPVTDAENILRAAYQTPTISGVGGMASADTYNVICPTGILAITECNYLTNATNNHVPTFLLEPATNAATMRGTFKKPNPLKYQVTTRRGFAFEYLANVRNDIDDEFKSATTARFNVIGHRRPKSVVVTIGGNATTIYFWHAPYGGQTQVNDLDVNPAYSAISQHNSGGQLAVCANIVFARYLGLTAPVADMSANTILVGDLNIRAAAVPVIYGANSNVQSSLEDLCHVISPQAIALTRVLAADWAPVGNQKYGCTIATYANLTSDHAPVIVDV